MAHFMSTRLAVALSFGAFLVTQTYILWTLGVESGAKLFQLQTGCCCGPRTGASTIIPAISTTVLDSWTPQDYERVRQHFGLDFWIHPVIYAVALVAAGMYAMETTTKRTRRNDTPAAGNLQLFMIIALPILGAACDIGENYFHWNALFGTNNAIAASTDMVATYIWYGCVLATTKWILMGLSVAQIVRILLFGSKEPLVHQD